MHWSRSQVVHQGHDTCISCPRCDTKKLRRHINVEDLRRLSGPSLPPLVLDGVAPKLIDPIMEYLTEHRSAKFLKAHVAVGGKAPRRRAANLSQWAHCMLEWPRGKFCSEEQKFASTVDVYTNLATFDKLRKVVEKRESTTLSDSHLALVLLSALPECIAHDVQVCCGVRPSIPYTQLRDLLPQHWHELTQK
ncbi:hypothetical protein H257_10426 [Aphanomyces astaci]|uniref:Uncharacterized protein n=1 Tax=Aphanomyces astaci TaxID=112090 RepID=W4G684_APHAT|nr:hypothetical protein H257_10426 [Aphanomyces astaci]ETV75232.1 hypothetical protein H257_10426 [Aphanomyces astaci]|eukprot:XP_009835280.1 hypothetical protein H257_10426 [Aphanomyces astaci]